ncbi:MAG TPA: hypothetical protein VGB94_06485 [Acidobacteriaceae bacterium]
MSSKQSLQLLSRFRAAAIALSLAAGIAAIPAVAQQAQTTAVPAASSYLASPNLQLFSSSSATSSQNEAVAGESASLSASHIGPNADANAQGGYGGAPPRRRPYGRPTYRDRYTNADGSSKLAWEAGAGFTVPTQESGQYLKPSYKFTFGAGRAFSKNFAILAEYNYDHFGIPDDQLRVALNTYNAAVIDYNSTASSANQASTLTSLNGNAHTWSLTLEPVLSFYSSGKAGAYVIGGGGFYRKLTNFTTPVDGYCYDYGYYECSSDQTVMHFSNNAGGLNIGAGLTYKVSSYSNLKLFAEARYVWIDNSSSPNNATTGAPQYGYPAANFETKYIPVTFGVRF